MRHFFLSLGLLCLSACGMGEADDEVCAARFSATNKAARSLVVGSSPAEAVDAIFGSPTDSQIVFGDPNFGDATSYRYRITDDNGSNCGIYWIVISNTTRKLLCIHDWRQYESGYSEPETFKKTDPNTGVYTDMAATCNLTQI